MFDKRLVATAIIWIAVTLILDNTTARTNSPNFDMTLVMALVVGSAFLATSTIWISDAIVQYRKAGKSGTLEKPKRREIFESGGDARVQLLMQLLDEREKAVIKSRLLNDVEGGGDGEISLDMLLSEFESER